ncbi:aminotransferase class I/II-fold pyridoxal phosphate-dependent enzyme [Burkholderia sp. FERM BP-3421]|jgi:DNA-binding transcriptional MocR family regulator|uniref:aminotransferase class I/II-fold pyridoxal phosphate-dependent enzyme n=1 Tax=Burkholderia sp. FERM BP-3421 TaxID=1494466 RepID=UPI00235E11DD|nr:aminotransferase class I/II-fold pyridoxal phosphate-dependent enzyme [Burkholderia sp. FERM BP-3421]WDD93109.1 aminotransferase class I/II-fold pyridoxal phosphate-dependent enzyme [Burkholderia sp. FERM BP-3421]
MTMTYEAFMQSGMRLDMSRGKPSPEQLDLATACFDAAGAPGHLSRDGIDCRNYGLPLGLPEARAFGAALLDVAPAQVAAMGNSSLELMHDALVFATLFGVPGGAPWRDIAFLCPVPGYDRHFSICASLGIRMINVPMRDDGPDLDFIEAQVRDDPAIKGIWCVPLYGNPTGAIYSAETVRRLASMPTAAPDFRLFWDDAYRFHHLTPTAHATPDVLAACAAAGHPDRALVFASLSKVTYGGGGVAFLAASKDNLDWWARHVSVRTIGPDKLNQLRHVRALRDRAGVDALMAGHRALLRPKFDAVHAAFGELLEGVPDVSWTRPAGGYFISLYGPRGSARRTVELAAQAGLVLTPAGAAYPHGRDPDDRHLRIAPSFPSLDEVTLAARGIALALRRAIQAD